MVCPDVTKEKIVQHTQLVPKVMLVTFFSRNGLVLDHPMPLGMMVNGQYYYALLQDKVRLALHHKQPELLEHGVILLQDNATPHLYCDVQQWGWEVLSHPP
jgi:Transposase.